MSATTATNSNVTPMGYVYRCVIAVCATFVVLCGLAILTDGNTPPAPAATHSPVGCWNEPNLSQPGGVEMIQGFLDHAPVGSVRVNCPASL